MTTESILDDFGCLFIEMVGGGGFEPPASTV
jgi:hypothetical protein